MANHVLLDNVTHKDLRVRTDFARGRGYDVNVARVFPVEFVRLQREYPLFFIKNAESSNFDAIALLGFEEGENLYLTEKGWDAEYVPLTIERQPFLIGFQEQVVEGVPRQAPVVHVDMDHPAVNDTDGERVFLPQGGESPFLERINSILMTIHQGYDVSQVFSQLLVGLELIESVAVEVEFSNGAKTSLTGLYSVNEDRMRALSASALETLNTRGHLQDVFLLLASLQNMPRLIERKNRQLSGLPTKLK